LGGQSQSPHGWKWKTILIHGGDNVFFLFTTVTDTNQSMQQCFYSSACFNQRN
jgi:hypothetical protein